MAVPDINQLCTLLMSQCLKWFSTRVSLGVGLIGILQQWRSFYMYVTVLLVNWSIASFPGPKRRSGERACFQPFVHVLNCCGFPQPPHTNCHILYFVHSKFLKFKIYEKSATCTCILVRKAKLYEKCFNVVV